jgi:CRP/FNR family transcriptional regulator
MTIQGAVARGSLVRHSQGAEILAQGEISSRIAIICSGIVKISTVNAEGDEHVLQLLHAGQFLGDPSARQSAFCWRAATEVELCWLSSTSLLAACRENPAIHLDYMAAIAGQMQQHYLFTLALRDRTTFQRVAYWLMTQIPQSQPLSDQFQFRILLSRRDLASLLDMTVETLCRALRQLAERRAITLTAPDRVVIGNLDKLRDLAKLTGDALPHARSAAGNNVAAALAGVQDVRRGQSWRAETTALTDQGDGR